MSTTKDKENIDPLSLQRSKDEKGRFESNLKWQRRVENQNKEQKSELIKNNKLEVARGKLTEDQAKRSESLLDAIQSNTLDARAKMLNPELHAQMAESIGVQKDAFIAHTKELNERENEKLRLQDEIKTLQDAGMDQRKEGSEKIEALQERITDIDKSNWTWKKKEEELEKESLKNMGFIATWTKKTYEGIQKQTFGDIAKDGFSGLKDDFMGLMGPASSILSNIPFLKPIASMVGKMGMKLFAYMANALKQGKLLAWWEKRKERNARIAQVKEWRRRKKEKKEPQKIEIEQKGGDKEGKGGFGIPIGMKIRGVAKALPLLVAPIAALGSTLAGLAPIAKFMIIGAGALGLALAALGAGAGVGLIVLGTGLIVVGAGMVKLAKGFESFDDLEGEKIKKNITNIGESMEWLSKMAWIGLLASIVGKVSGGLPDLANSFKTFDPTIEGNVKGKEVAANITALGTAMESLGSITSTSLGASFKSWVGSFFTKEDENGNTISPMQRLATDLKAFETVDGDKLAAAAPGIITLSSAMNEWGKNTPDVGMIDAMAGGIQSLFGNDMMSTLEKIAELPVGIGTKADALKKVASSFDLLANSIKNLNDQDLERWWEYVVEGIDNWDHVTITPSVSIASVEGMHTFGSQAGVVINSAATSGANGGGNVGMVSNVMAPTTQINQSNTRKYAATGAVSIGAMQKNHQLR